MQGTRLYDQQQLTTEQEDLILARDDGQCAECSEQASECLCDGGEREPDDLDQQEEN
jgi:hypothetical protein